MASSSNSLASHLGGCREELVTMSKASAFVLIFSVILCRVSGFTQPKNHPSARFSRSCRNTVQGRSLLTDEHGYICSVQDIHLQSGCCPQVEEPFQCNGCNLTAKCCNAYEYCVACCLSPNQTSNDRASKVKVAQHASAGTYKDSFDFCLGRCRHDSRSVVHENAYATEDHHCFSLPTNISSQTSISAEDKNLDGLTIVIGRLGQSCETACDLKGQTCQLSKLAAINKCTILQKYFSCRGRCVASIDQPAEVSPSAPRPRHPGACLFARHDSALSCEAHSAYTRRLCPCA